MLAAEVEERFALFSHLIPSGFDVRDFVKSLLSNLIRDETREEPERFYESGLAQGG